MEQKLEIDSGRGRAQKLGEEIANAISHGMGALLAIAGLVVLLVHAVKNGVGALGVVSAALYGASMVVLYTVSCIYHALTTPRGKHVFQVLDHCSIFLLILGTYIPLALLGVGGVFGWVVFGIIAACAVVGMVLNAVDLQRFKRFSMVLYIAMGWLAVLALPPLYASMGWQGIALLLGGGLFYTLGVIFYKQKEKQYMHFVWHLFVLAGSVMHFLMIFRYYWVVA